VGRTLLSDAFAFALDLDVDFDLDLDAVLDSAPTALNSDSIPTTPYVSSVGRTLLSVAFDFLSS